MPLRHGKWSIFLACFLLVLVLQGCDQVSKFFGYFSPKSKQKTQVASTASPSAPSATNTNATQANVLARVGNWTLTTDDFKERLKALKEVVPEYDPKNKEQNKLILDELVRQQLLVQEAEKNGVAQSKDIQQAVDEFRRTLLVREIATKLIEGLTVTDQEAQEYFTQNQKDMVKPAEYHLREIVVDNEAAAKAAAADLAAGADFAEMAKNRSKSASSANGGDLGLITQFPFQKMEQAVTALAPGGVSSVFQGPDGFYIVKLEEKKGGEPLVFEDVKGEIKQGLLMLKQQQAVLKHIEDIRATTTVQVNETLLEGI
jgi:peptidyl-prolyl cis-trans isomerase C